MFGHRRGASAIEFGLTVPIIILVLGAIVELSLYINNYYWLERASKDGARVATSVIPPSTDPEGLSIELIAEAHAVEMLDAISQDSDVGFPVCPAGVFAMADPDDELTRGQCGVFADWCFNDADGWYYVEVTVQDAYDGLTLLSPANYLEGNSRARFTMLTRFQCQSDSCTPNICGT